MKDKKKLISAAVVVLLAAIGYFKIAPNPESVLTGITVTGAHSPSEAQGAAENTAEPRATLMKGPNGLTDIGPTLERIRQGIKHPHRNDGGVFQNREGLLPKKPPGYYREYVHPTPQVRGPGAQRLVLGKGGEIYYTPDHYRSFIEVPQ